MQGLYNATKNWDNIPNMNLIYNDMTDNTNAGYTGGTYGYTGITITNGLGYITKKDGTQTAITLTNNKPIKARLPKLEEVYNAGTDDSHCHNSISGSCPAWLTNGLAQYSTDYSDNEHIPGILGYWLLSSYPNYSDFSRCVYYYGYKLDYNETSNTRHYGVRPVITLSKYDLN